MIEGVYLTIGVFDGVHLGHQEVIRHLVGQASQRGAKTLLLTFDPHPLKVIAPKEPPLLLTSLEEKRRIISKLGVNETIILPFNMEVANMKGRDFIKEILLPLKIKKIFVGSNYRFGRKREGDIQLLMEMGKEYGFEVEGVLPFRMEDDGILSSSRIRESLSLGEVEQAERFLGRPFLRQARVISGKGRGRAMGYPTANLQWDKELLLPKNGVYAVYTIVGRERFCGMANIGQRPTFKEKDLSFEVHLFDFKGNIYGQQVEIIFVKRIRDEMVFESSSSLKARLIEDEALARKILVAKEKRV